MVITLLKYLALLDETPYNEYMENNRYRLSSIVKERKGGTWMEIAMLVKNDIIHVESLILDQAEQLGLDVEQLGFLLLFYRYTKKTAWLLPSMQYFAKLYHLDLGDVKRLQNVLLQNGYCEIEAKTDGTTLIEYVNWQLLYNRLEGKQVAISTTKETSTKVEIVQLIEREFGRMLSPIEIELAGIWAQSYTYEDVIDALKEAVLSDVKNMKYIDKILQNWSQGGRRKTSTKSDVSMKEQTVLLDDYYNWLESGDQK